MELSPDASPRLTTDASTRCQASWRVLPTLSPLLRSPTAVLPLACAMSSACREDITAAPSAASARRADEWANYRKYFHQLSLAMQVS